VALAVCVLCVACVVRFGLSGRTAVALLFCAVLVVLAAVDLERRIIPNRIVLPATLAVLGAQLALYPDRALEWIVASLAAALFLFLPLLLFPSGMGMGDVKLALLLGAALGASVATALVVAVLAAFLAALVLLVRGGIAARKTAFAFGPFLAFGGIVALFLA
jgi:leader peptidase (prepilin peptidase) / N-methyltransferase